MGVVIGLFVAGAMTVGLGGAILLNVKVWELARESRREFRKLPAEKRRDILIRGSVISAVVLAYFAVVLIAPFGIRQTLTYVVIVPFVVIAPLAIVAVGVHGFRGQRKRRPPPG